MSENSTRRYYSLRTQKNPNANKFELPVFRQIFKDLYWTFLGKEYFQEAFGYECVDVGFVPGKIGMNVEAQIFRKLRKTELWPI